VPREQPYRQWLSDDDGKYLIADVWKDPELLERVISRLRRGSMSWKRLALYLENDLEYLDEFARRGDAALSAQLYWRAVQEDLVRKHSAEGKTPTSLK
jgi:hypothetical protein